MTAESTIRRPSQPHLDLLDAEEDEAVDTPRRESLPEGCKVVLQWVVGSAAFPSDLQRRRTTSVPVSTRAKLAKDANGIRRIDPESLAYQAVKLLVAFTILGQRRTRLFCGRPSWNAFHHRSHIAESSSASDRTSLATGLIRNVDAYRSADSFHSHSYRCGVPSKSAMPLRGPSSNSVTVCTRSKTMFPRAPNGVAFRRGL